MIEITLQEGDRLEWALKSFKRKVIQSGLFAELRRRRHYVKPSEARALKDELALRRARAAARRAARLRGRRAASRSPRHDAH
ncbi:30S ribosomal protein S21 [Gemmatirosa kalamazoonensis]|jgi:small subunit ribosomal protein S21|uniref:Small ribosomal subunit protein bS21 n=1 Tax=Gemmatirosa kalamazoonensis TaxID=861299 RepID=W0RGI4_9BACT|nr:30S ribosomal protein S21 [Gemmatirosa kalamazoonensis]AHG89450.1 30S ribosomal protein S21 [Gemmatirosa kalamazoonensis]